MKSLKLSLSLLLSALTVASFGQVTTPVAGSKVRAMIMDAIRPSVEKDIGIPVIFVVRTLHLYGSYAFTNVLPEQKNGSQIAWSRTKYRRDYNGAAFTGVYWYFLKKRGSSWHIVSKWDPLVSDVEWVDYPQKYGVPQSMFNAN